MITSGSPAPAAVADAAFRAWLRGQLAGLPAAVRGRLSFELTETSLMTEPASVTALVNDLQALDVELGIDHYGRNFSDVGQLHARRPGYVKLDGAYTRDLEQDEHTRFMVRALCGAVRGLGARVIVEAVQDRDRLETLAGLGVYGAQGFALEAPHPLEDYFSPAGTSGNR